MSLYRAEFEPRHQAIKHSTLFIRKAKLTEDQIAIDAERIAEQLLRANFQVMKGEPANLSGWAAREKAAPPQGGGQCGGAAATHVESGSPGTDQKV